MREGGVYIDGTFGAGGHTRAILQVAGTRVIGIDRDRSAIAGGADLVEAAAGRLTLAEDRFANLEQVARDLGHASVDGILLDLGVSSMQLDQAERGFSFRHDGPLDMRMGGGAERGRSRECGVGARPCADHRDARRGASARNVARDRQRSRRATDRDDVRSRRSSKGRARPAGRDPSCDAHLPGLAHVRERRARRARHGACGSRAHPKDRRPSRGDLVSLARGPRGEDLPRRARPHRRRLAPSARGAARPAEFQAADAQADRRG